jgi:hypothetical protein
MLSFLAGLIIGAALVTPVLPLLRVTDPAFGRAAVGIAMIGVALFAIQFWVHSDTFDADSFKGFALMATETAVRTGPAFLVSAVIAAVGVTHRRRG